MSFKDQLRDWLGGLWSDFWRVPLPHFLVFGALALLTIIAAAWRIGATTDTSLRHSYYAFSPLLLALILAILAIAKRAR